MFGSACLVSFEPHCLVSVRCTAAGTCRFLLASASSLVKCLDDPVQDIVKADDDNGVQTQVARRAVYIALKIQLRGQLKKARRS